MDIDTILKASVLLQDNQENSNTHNQSGIWTCSLTV